MIMLPSSKACPAHCNTACLASHMNALRELDRDKRGERKVRTELMKALLTRPELSFALISFPFFFSPCSWACEKVSKAKS